MVIIYGKDTCNWCDRARELCEQLHIEYTYKSVDDRFDGATYLAELKQLSEEQSLTIKTVPQIWWNKKYIGGFDQFAAEVENNNIGNFGQGAF